MQPRREDFGPSIKIEPDRPIEIMEKPENTGTTERIGLSWGMRADDNASMPKKKVTSEFLSELANEDASFDPLYSPQKERTEEEAEGNQGRNESWHTFKTP